MNISNVGKVQQCEDCGEVFTITRRYDFCRSCYCPECGDKIDKRKGYCAPCSAAAERFEEMAYGRDD
jgi:predicted amidophosphoribosyltransferase